VNAYRTMKVTFIIILTWVLDGGTWSDSRFDYFLAGSYWVGGCVGSGTSLDINLTIIEI
jgi:hypothetical protein